MQILATILLLIISLSANGQTPDISKWIDTEVTYTTVYKRSVFIQSSLPKGGGRYTDSEGKQYSYVIFWIRMINKSAKPAALTMKFPATPFKIFPSPESYIRLFLPPDSMTLEKVPLGDYGLTTLKSFLDADFYKPGLLHKIIPPQGESLFYIPILLHQAQGTTRVALVLKEQDLFLKISIGSDVNAELISCGQLVFKD